MIFVVIVSVFAVLMLVGIFIALHENRRPSRTPTGPQRDRGVSGERFISRLLHSCCHSEHDHVLDDVILYDPRRNSSCEIDHIFICPLGVYIIETKNKSGKIYGSDHDEEWTQVMGNGNIVHTFRSPLLQNATHVAFASGILQKRLTAHVPIIGTVVFVQGNTEHINSSSVCTPFELKKMLNTGERLITPEEQDRAYRTLRSHLERYPVTKQQHLQYIRSLHANDRER